MERRARLNAVKAAVREADPLGLVEVGAPDDEYDAEIEDIERRLRPDMTPGEAADVIDEVMHRWFGDQEWAKHRHRSIAALSKRLSQISSSASP